MIATSGSGSEAGDEGQIEQVEENLVPKSEDNQQQESGAEVPVPRRAVMNRLSPPTSMQLTGNLADNWKRFKQRFNIYI